MRSSNTLRFFGFSAAIFLFIIILGLTFRKSLPQPDTLLEHLPKLSLPAGFGSHTDYKANPQGTLADETKYDLHKVNLRKYEWWDPTQYDDEPLPPIDQWPGPEEDGKYGDIRDQLAPEELQASIENQHMEHLRIKSKMTSTGKFIKIDWLGEHEGYNPSIIPHPSKDDTWIAIAQREKSRDEDTIFSQQLYCEATWVNDTIKCTRSPLQLPIASTWSPHCTGKMSFFENNVGPHDARLFHGRTRPYVLYYQQSQFSCVGMWINDARRLIDYGSHVPTNKTDRFFWPTNLQKAGGKYNVVEKNWFLFWDARGELYIHYSFTPNRMYARLNEDGSVGEDLSHTSREHDQTCLQRLLPKLKPTKWEFYHQASNALEITMCKRSDPDCRVTEDNTFIFVIIQTKTFYLHGQYEPYIMMFKRNAPFEIYGVSKTPFWYHGRGTAFGKWRIETGKPIDQSQMIFTTQISWQKRGLTYTGYLDDELMIAFGVEDKHSGVMDVTAEYLMADMAYC